MAGGLTEHEHRVLLALAAVAIPAGEFIPEGNAATIARVASSLAALPPWAATGLRGLVWALDLAPLATHRARFTALSRSDQSNFLDGWQTARSPQARQVLRALVTAIKAAHFDDPTLFARVGCPFGVTPGRDERPRWLAQVTDGSASPEDHTIEADAVVVGTGAGGAAVAYELARRGHAVVLLEEGRYHRREAFNGRVAEMTRLLYRDMGLTVALGNIATPVWSGRAVGGSTTINSGTCYRAPADVFDRWQRDDGLRMFSTASMDAYYSRVEDILGVAEGAREHLGGVARVIARGAERMGLSHAPLRRNAPGCDGQGVCCFGCPTGAKRSTDVSYVPLALERGAMLVTSAKVRQVTLSRGSAVGITGTTAGGGKLTVRAKITVVAGGALMTPSLLAASGVRSPMLGRGLSIHPASKVMALFDERIDMALGIPQSYAIEEFARDGVMFEGASLPFDLAAVSLPFVGRRFTDVMEKYAHLATFGYMIRDTSRGSVRRGPTGRPTVFYSLNNTDAQRMKSATATLCEVFLRAGATRVFPGISGWDEIRTGAEVDALHRARISPGDLELTAFHPLGTARMGTDPRRSVVGPDHECHTVRDLFVCDGSVVPTPLGVNPQMTIMAMSTRAGEILDERLTRSAAM